MVDFKKYEYTIQNLYFHENASIYSMDSFEDSFLTAGGDRAIRLWKISYTDLLVDKPFTVNEAHQSSLKIVHEKSYEMHTGIVNTVRFSKDGSFFVSGADGGEIYLWLNNERIIVRHPDGDDVYDVISHKNFIFGVSASGKLHVYEILFPESAESQKRDRALRVKHVQTLKIHSDVVQGVSYNAVHNLLISGSKDRSYKLYAFDKKITFHDKIEVYRDTKVFADENSKIIFRRPAFSRCGRFLYLVSGIGLDGSKDENHVYILHYPFRCIDFYGKIGPLESEAIKVICCQNYNVIICKKNVYLFKDNKVYLNVKNSAFYPMTDACAVEPDILLFSSLDGFIYSLRLFE